MRISRLLILDRLQGSLFFIPLMYIVGATALAILMITVDNRIAPSAADLPFIIGSTVDSSRAVLGTVAAATVTVAGIAFSVALLVIQLASSQFSPRVVQGLFRDPFNKRVMGLVLGTFTYCLVVLQSVRSAISSDGEDVVPNLSVVVALFLGVGSILAIVAFINHNAHTMDVSEILQAVTDQSIESVDECWPVPDQAPPPLPEPHIDGDGHTVRFESAGWVQLVDEAALLAAVGEDGVVRLHTGVGRYAIIGAPLATLWPVPSDRDEAESQIRGALHLGRTRTMAQDPAYGIRQLADVGIRALSAGIDDPTTAQDAIFHLAAVLRAVQSRISPPAVVVDDDRRCLVYEEAPDHGALVRLAYDELRRSAATHPTVCIYLIEALSLLCRAEPAPPDDAVAAMRKQAGLIVAEAQAADLVPHDIDLVVSAYDTRFGSR